MPKITQLDRHYIGFLHKQGDSQRSDSCLCACVCYGVTALVITYLVCTYVKDDEMNPGIKEMEAMILECAKLDREINYFVDVVQQVTAEVRAA